MKPYALALAICCSIGIVLFAIVYFTSHDAHIAEAVGALPIVASHNIAEMLERRETRTRVAARDTAGIESVEAFAIAWPTVLANAIISLIAVGFIADAVAVVAVAIIVPDFGVGPVTPSQIAAVLLAATPLKLVAGFLIGRRIGMRSRSRAWVIALATALLGPLIANYGMDAILWPFGAATQDDLRQDMVAVPVSFAQFAVAGLIGVWRGRRRQLAGYMEYLLSVLPSATRNALVDLAYEDAKKAP